VGVMHAVGDPTKQVLAKVLEDIEHLEEYVRARLSPEAGWLTPETVGGAEPPKPWRINVEDGRPVLWTSLESWRKYLQRALGELRQVSRRKETGEEVEWVETRVKDLGPALDRKAFASLLKPYLSHVIRRYRRRNLKVVFTSLEDIVKAREALRRALPEGNFAACQPALGAGETSRVQDTQTARAESVQDSCTTCAPPCADAVCNPAPGGGEGGVKNSEGGESRKEVSDRLPPDAEEEKAWEELERFIEEHRPEGPATDAEKQDARHGGEVEKLSKDEIVKIVRESLKKLETAEEEASQQPRRGAIEKKSKDEIIREFEEIVKEYGEL